MHTLFRITLLTHKSCLLFMVIIITYCTWSGSRDVIASICNCPSDKLGMCPA